MKAAKIKCDAFGCDETYPMIHDSVGKPGFEDGKWPRWLYLDLNRPEFFSRPLTFCTLGCLLHWLRMNAASENPVDARIDPRTCTVGVLKRADATNALVLLHANHEPRVVKVDVVVNETKGKR